MSFIIDFAKDNPRTCGSCTLCCRLVPVERIGKKAGERCRHQFSRGCRLHGKPAYPTCCQLWSCKWLMGQTSEGMLRPDRCGYVIDPMPDTVTIRNTETDEGTEVMVMQVWVDPGRGEAWRHDQHLQAYIDRQGEQGVATLVRYNARDAWAIFPAAMNDDKVRREFPPGADGTEVRPERRSWVEKQIALARSRHAVR